MISKKDKEILLFIEKYKSITINQCAKCVFTNNKWREDQSRKKLRKLYKEKLIARFQSNRTSEVVYYTISRLGLHDLKLLDIFAEFISLGATVDKFEREYRIYTPEGKKKYRDVDGYMEISFTDSKGEIFQINCIIEIEYSHFSSMDKFLDIYNSNHFQELYGQEIFPLIILVKPATETKLIIENNLLFLYVDWELSNLKQALE